MGGVVGVLVAASAADAEVRAIGCYAVGRGNEDGVQIGFGEAALIFGDGGGDGFAGQGEGDEDGFAGFALRVGGMRQAIAPVERLFHDEGGEFHACLM